MTCNVGTMSHGKFWFIKRKSWTTASGKHFLLKYVSYGILQNMPYIHFPHFSVQSSREIPFFNLPRQAEWVNTDVKTTLCKQSGTCEILSNTESVANRIKFWDSSVKTFWKSIQWKLHIKIMSFRKQSFRDFGVISLYTWNISDHSIFCFCYSCQYKVEKKSRLINFPYITIFAKF